MLVSPTIPASLASWLLILIIGIVIVIHNLLHFKSLNYLEASIGGAVSEIKLVWVFVLGVLLAHELFTWEKLIGTLLTVAAGIIIVGKIKRPKTNTGIWYMLGSTFFYAAIIVLYKYLFVTINAVSATFFAAFLVPAVVNLVFIPKAKTRLVHIIKNDGKYVFIASGLGAFANLALIYGLSTGDATRVVVILEAFLILTLVGEHVFLKEKEHVWVKIAAVIFALVGAILIRISG